MKRIIVLAAISVLGVSSMANAFPLFGGNNLVVVRVGNGGALGSSATATFLEEYAISGGAIVQPAIALPTTDSGGNQTLTLSGTATSEGFLKRSTNGQYLTMIGYDAATGTGSITSSTAASINRIVARIDSSALIDTTTALADASSTSNPRSAISTNGTDLWVSGGAGGSRYTTLGGTTSTQLSTSPTNLRVLNIFNTQLYTTSGSSPFIGVSTIDGPGPATTAGQATTLLPGFTGSSGPSPYDFYFASFSLLYVCDDRSAASGGGLQRWDLNAGTWSNTYTLALGTTTAGGCRGLTGTFNGTTATLYATTTESSANRLVSITDTGAGSTFTTLETAATNTVFRGIAFAPTVPEPTTLSLLVFGALAFIRRRR